MSGADAFHALAQPLSLLSAPLPLPTLPALAPATGSDVALTAGILGGVSVYLAACQRLVAGGTLSSVAVRKLVHITCGPAFVALWPLYSSDGAGPRALAAAVPALFVCVLLVSGTARAGNADDESSTDDAEGHYNNNDNNNGSRTGSGGSSGGRRGALARALSRSGDAREALAGPLYYAATLLVLTAVLFRSGAAGVAICQLCIGDGLAEVVGRAFGRGTEWARVFAAVLHSGADGAAAAAGGGGSGGDKGGSTSFGGKSVAGSAAFVVGAFAATLACLQWLRRFGLTGVDTGDGAVVAAVAALSVACAAVELAPADVVGDDNVAIGVTAVALSVAVWGAQVL